MIQFSRVLFVAIVIGVTATTARGEIAQLVCRGETYSVASGERTAVTRFSRRELTVTADSGRTEITYGDENPIEADITGSHYRATRSARSGDWVLILLDRDTLDVTVSEFSTLPGKRHRSERFVGRCEVSEPLATAF